MLRILFTRSISSIACGFLAKQQYNFILRKKSQQSIFNHMKFGVSVATSANYSEHEQLIGIEQKIKSDEVRNYIASKIRPNLYLKIDEWESIIENIIGKMTIYTNKKNSKFQVTNSNKDSILMNSCFNELTYQTALSYLHFIEKKSPINNKQVSNYINERFLFITAHAVCNGEDVDLKLVENICNKFEETILLNKTFSALLTGYSILKKYDVVENYIKTSSDRISNYESICKVLFYYGEYERGWKIAENMLNGVNCLRRKEFGPQLNLSLRSAIIYYFKICKQLVRNLKGDLEDEKGKLEIYTILEFLLNFLKNNKLFLDRDLNNEIKYLFEKIGWEVTLSTINFSTGICNSCLKKLKLNVVSKQNFEDLRNSVYNDVLKSEDIYRNSSPKEVKKFLKFMEHNYDFKVVIDGLNVALRSSNKSLQSQNEALEAVIKPFTIKNERVLVITRNHMKNYDIVNKYQKDKNVKFYFLTQITQDDPFIIIAALLCGSGTYILTNDYLRQHYYVIKNERIQSIFMDWQLQNQIKTYSIFKSSKGYQQVNLTLRYPIPYSLESQYLEDSWHIPSESLQDRAEMDIPVVWYCIQNNSSRIKKSSESNTISPFMDENNLIK